MPTDNGNLTIHGKGTIRNYRDLVVWQKAMSLVEQIYSITRQFPTDERFGLIAQIRRAAVSVPSNIAEGQARKSTREFVLFISHAEGSLAEVDTQLTLSARLGFCKPEEAAKVFAPIEEIRKMLASLRSRLNDQRR